MARNRRPRVGDTLIARAWSGDLGIEVGTPCRVLAVYGDYMDLRCDAQDLVVSGVPVDEPSLSAPTPAELARDVESLLRSSRVRGVVGRRRR